MDWSKRTPRGTGAAIVVLVIAVVGVLPGLQHPAGAAPAGTTAAVTVEGFSFTPQALEVKAGTKVVWTNNDDVTHTVTSGTPEQRTNVFNQSLSGKGTRFEFTFAKAGTFMYFCARHNRMRGRVVVKE